MKPAPQRPRWSLPARPTFILAYATKQAAEGVTNGSGNSVSTVMLNALITYLQGMAQ